MQCGHVQAIYQCIIILVFHFAGQASFDLKDDHDESFRLNLNNDTKLNTLVFAQIFNSINSRRIDSRKNVFEGVFRNWYFIIITLLGKCTFG